MQRFVGSLDRLGAKLVDAALVRVDPPLGGACGEQRSERRHAAFERPHLALEALDRLGDRRHDAGELPYGCNHVIARRLDERWCAHPHLVAIVADALEAGP